MLWNHHRLHCRGPNDIVFQRIFCLSCCLPRAPLLFSMQHKFCIIGHASRVRNDFACRLYKGFSIVTIWYCCRYLPAYRVLKSCRTLEDLNCVIYFIVNVHICFTRCRGDVKRIQMDSPQASIGVSTKQFSQTHDNYIAPNECAFHVDDISLSCTIEGNHDMRFECGIGFFDTQSPVLGQLSSDFRSSIVVK